MEQKAISFSWAPLLTSMDSPYAITMRPLLKRVADQIINRGHMIGFHPGYQTFRDSKKFCEHKKFGIARRRDNSRSRRTTRNQARLRCNAKDLV